MKERIHKVRRKLREKKGSTYVETAAGILAVIVLLALIVQFVPVLILKGQLNTFATNVSRIVSVEGQYNDEVREMIEDYRQASEVGEITISLEDSDFISGTEKIQLNDQIVVTVTTGYDIGFFRFGSFQISLTNKALARSEVYWKD